MATTASGCCVPTSPLRCCASLNQALARLPHSHVVRHSGSAAARDERTGLRPAAGSLVCARGHSAQKPAARLGAQCQRRRACDGGAMEPTHRHASVRPRWRGCPAQAFGTGALGLLAPARSATRLPRQAQSGSSLCARHRGAKRVFMCVRVCLCVCVYVCARVFMRARVRVLWVMSEPGEGWHGERDCQSLGVDGTPHQPVEPLTPRRRMRATASCRRPGSCAETPRSRAGPGGSLRGEG